MRRFAILIVLALVAGLGIDAGAAGGRDSVAAAAKRCRAHTVPLVVSRDGRKVTTAAAGRRVCVRRPKLPSASGALLRFELSHVLMNPALAAGNRKVAKGLRSRVLKRLLGRAVDALGAAATSARASRESQTTTTVENGVTVTRTVTAPDNDEVGAGVTERTGAIKAGSSTATGTLTDSAFAKMCPDGGGKVPGERHYVLGTTAAIPAAPGVTLSLQITVSWDATFEGHVGDDARLKDFDYSGTGSMETKAELLDAATGKRLQHVPTQVVRFTVSRNGIDPHNPTAAAADVFKNHSFNARGPKGASFTGTQISGLALLIATADSDIAEKAAKVLLTAEQAWYGDANAGGRCLDAEFNPPSLDLQQGQSGDVEVRIHQHFDHSEVPIHLKAEAGGPCPGSVSPNEFDATGHVTYTAGTCSVRPVGKGSFIVEGVSKHGRVTGVDSDITIRSSPVAYVGTASGFQEGRGGGGDFERESWTATDVRFDQEPGRPTRYLISAGTVNWSLSGTVAGGMCTESGSATLPAVGGSYAGEIDLVGSQYGAGATYARNADVTIVCNGGGGGTGPRQVTPDWFDSNGRYGSNLVDVKPDGTLSGSVDESSGGGSGTPGGSSNHWEWSLSPVY